MSVRRCRGCSPALGSILVPLLTQAALSGCGAGSQTVRYLELVQQLDTSLTTRSRAEGLLPIWFEDPIALDRQGLIAAVIERNPTIRAARQAWREALAHYPQATSFDDPTLKYSMAPGSIGSADVDYGQVVEIAQRLPWPGKLALRGAVALAEAEASRADVEAAQLHLALMASLLFDDWFVVARAIEINVEHLSLLKRLKRVSRAQFTAGRGSLQDPLQAEVELAHIEHEQIVLRTRRGIIAAQLNGLLHQPMDATPPPPPETLEVPEPPPEETSKLVAQALAARPNLRAGNARLRAAAAATEAAQREYFPDFTVSGSYNSMWRSIEHQLMVGVAVNVPLQLDRRSAAVDTAEADVIRARSELAQLQDDARVELARAQLRSSEAHHVLSLYDSRILPAARAQLRAAEAGYRTGRNGFVALIDAERNLRAAKLAYERAVAAVWSRTAELERALGRMPGAGFTEADR